MGSRRVKVAATNNRRRSVCGVEEMLAYATLHLTLTIQRLTATLTSRSIIATTNTNIKAMSSDKAKAMLFFPTLSGISLNSNSELPATRDMATFASIDTN